MICLGTRPLNLCLQRRAVECFCERSPGSSAWPRMLAVSVHCPNLQRDSLESDGAGDGMIQRQITHVAGTFPACTKCGKEPFHFVANGSTRHEAVTFAPNGERHQLECSCERRTGWRKSVMDAVLAWDVLGEIPSFVPEAIQVDVHPIRVCCLPIRKPRRTGSSA